jgi:hypothetical protein
MGGMGSPRVEVTAPEESVPSIENGLSTCDNVCGDKETVPHEYFGVMETKGQQHSETGNW